MKRKQGYTLIELLISLGIMSIIITMLLSFFVVEVKTYEDINIDSKLEFQSQYILNFMAKKIMESKKVKYVKNGTDILTNSTTEQSITKLSLLHNDQNQQCHIFEKKYDKIFYGYGTYDGSTYGELGTYITEVKVAPFPDGSSFSNAAALKITVKLSRKNHVYEATQLVYFRS